MSVGEICNRQVVVAPKGEMVIDAARRMRTSHVGALIVIENRNGRHIPIGILTDRDIVVSAVQASWADTTLEMTRVTMATYATNTRIR